LLHTTKSAYTLGLLLPALVVAGCARDEQQKSYVARVDQSFLTEQDLAAVHDSLGDVRAQSREYINAWIDTELLYLEAVRQGLADSESLRRQLEMMRRRLAVGALLEKDLYADSTGASDDAIQALYNAGGDAFRLREDVANISFALFGERDVANAFRSSLLRGTSWNDALRQVQTDSLMHPLLLQVADKQYFTQATLYPQELWKLSRTLGKGEVSFVVKTDNGYYVLTAHSLRRQGEMPDLDYIRPEIRDRILIEQRRARYERMVADLKAKHTVEVRISLADTTAPVPE
jgi:hypothetical protein